MKWLPNGDDPATVRRMSTRTVQVRAHTRADGTAVAAHPRTITVPEAQAVAGAGQLAHPGAAPCPAEAAPTQAGAAQGPPPSLAELAAMGKKARRRALREHGPALLLAAARSGDPAIVGDTIAVYGAHDTWASQRIGSLTDDELTELLLLIPTVRPAGALAGRGDAAWQVAERTGAFTDPDALTAEQRDAGRRPNGLRHGPRLPAAVPRHARRAGGERPRRRRPTVPPDRSAQPDAGGPAAAGEAPTPVEAWPGGERRVQQRPPSRYVLGRHHLAGGVQAQEGGHVDELLRVGVRVEALVGAEGRPRPGVLRQYTRNWRPRGSIPGWAA